MRWQSCWSGPIIIDTSTTVGVRDPKSGYPVRAGAIIAGIAADLSGGKIYVVWQDSRFSSGLRDAIALSTSIDGGISWSTPIRVSQSPDVPAFTPAVAVSASGKVAVTSFLPLFSAAAFPGHTNFTGLCVQITTQ